MKIHPEKHIEKRIIIFTGIGIIAVLFVWGLQLNKLIKDVASSTSKEASAQAFLNLQEGQTMANRLKESLPLLQMSFSEFIEQLKAQKTQVAEEETMSAIAEELKDELERVQAEQKAIQTEEADSPEQTQ